MLESSHSHTPEFDASLTANDTQAAACCCTCYGHLINSQVGSTVWISNNEHAALITGLSDRRKHKLSISETFNI